MSVTAPAAAGTAPAAESFLDKLATVGGLLSAPHQPIIADLQNVVAGLVAYAEHGDKVVDALEADFPVHELAALFNPDGYNVPDAGTPVAEQPPAPAAIPTPAPAPANVSVQYGTEAEVNELRGEIESLRVQLADSRRTTVTTDNPSSPSATTTQGDTSSPSSSSTPAVTPPAAGNPSTSDPGAGPAGPGSHASGAGSV